MKNCILSACALIALAVTASFAAVDLKLTGEYAAIKAIPPPGDD